MLVNRINSKARFASHCEQKAQRAPRACKWLTRAARSLREARPRT